MFCWSYLRRSENGEARRVTGEGAGDVRRTEGGLRRSKHKDSDWALELHTSSMARSSG